MACGSILLKIAVLELVIIKLIHKFVEDFQIESSIQSLVEENWTDYAMPGDCTPHTCLFQTERSIDMLLMKQGM